jgi:hypothetical protein
MKRFTLLFVLICTGVLTFGQVTRTETDAPIKQDKDTYEGVNPNFLKGSGDVFWQTTFNWADPSNPRGWTLPEGWTVGEAADLGNNWVWRNDTLKGNFTNQAAPAHFVSGADGFIALPIDEYNSRDGITVLNNADSWITTAPIDCSAVSSVVVKFSQYFRLCCSNYFLEMLVTNDGGVHWATYDVRFNVGGNLVTTANYRNVEVNISDVAAGLPSVQIRFYMHGMQRYFWMIDDLKLAEAFQHDLVMEDFWADFDGGNDATIEHVNFWPLSQMGMAGASSGTVGGYYFKSAFMNNGMQDAEGAKLDLRVLKNGTEIYADMSPGMDIWSLERDTQKVANPWLADDYGDYQFNFNGVTSTNEEVPINNNGTLKFTVNDTLGHRADFSAETSMNTGGWSNGGRAGDMVAVSYDLYAAAEINSITAYIAGFTAAETPQFQFVLMKEIEGEMTEWTSSDVIDMDSSYRNSWVTLPIVKDGETEFLQPGNYYTCVRMWGTKEGAEFGTQGMSVGRDLTTKFSGCPQWYTSSGAWTNLAGAPLAMIGFNLNTAGGPTQAPATFNVDMTKHIASGEFNPGADFVDVAGTFNEWNGSAHMTDADADGIYTITIDALQVNSVIEYKYRINGNWDTSEYPNGGANRKYTVRYWNVINNTYNGGVTSSVNPTSLVASFDVYPNPSQGEFTVNITNKVASNMIITLTNIQGQVIYQNKVTNVVNHQETINNQLSKGLYFLSVNNGSEVKVQKVVIQ